MSELQYCSNKSLKLTNVLKYKVLVDKEDFDINIAIERMQSYIKSKGAMQIGPLIQYTNTFKNDMGAVDLEVIILLQCNKFLHNVESPYFMESLIRIHNALYCRYIGPEKKLKVAYDKINVEAFQENIELKNSIYTVYVNNDLEKDIMVADVFMERAE